MKLQLTEVNVSCILCPAVSDPFRGRFYRLATVTHQGILVPLVTKVYNCFAVSLIQAIRWCCCIYDKDTVNDCTKFIKKSYWAEESRDQIRIFSRISEGSLCKGEGKESRKQENLKMLPNLSPKMHKSHKWNQNLFESCLITSLNIFSKWLLNECWRHSDESYIPIKLFYSKYVAFMCCFIWHHYISFVIPSCLIIFLLYYVFPNFSSFSYSTFYTTPCRIGV